MLLPTLSSCRRAGERLGQNGDTDAAGCRKRGAAKGAGQRWELLLLLLNHPSPSCCFCNPRCEPKNLGRKEVSQSQRDPWESSQLSEQGEGLQPFLWHPCKRGCWSAGAGEGCKAVGLFVCALRDGEGALLWASSLANAGSGFNPCIQLSFPGVGQGACRCQCSMYACTWLALAARIGKGHRAQAAAWGLEKKVQTWHFGGVRDEGGHLDLWHGAESRGCFN